MEYNFTDIEKRWQNFWATNKTFKAEDSSIKPKYYVLDFNRPLLRRKRRGNFCSSLLNLKCKILF